MKLGRNLLAGLANSVWSALVGLAVVPFYLKYLGIEAYGLIGFFVTTQAVLSLLDMGMAPTINREVARCSASGNLQEAGGLLHTLAVVYWAMALMIALLILALAPWIAEYWLQSKQLSAQTISHAIMLMGLVVACRWPIGLYQGALIGAQRLTVASGISIAMVTFGSMGAVAVLAFVSPTIEAFFIWQACVGLVYAATMRWGAWRIIGRMTGTRFDVDKLKSLWRFSAGMSGIAITGVILMQLDKVMLSRLLSLEDFGRYMLAGVVASGLYILLTPLFNAIYPRMTALVASGEIEKLTDLYKTGTRLFFALFFPVVIMAAASSEELLYLWTRNQQLATSSALIVSLMLLGTAMNGVMHFPYALLLAYGETRLPFNTNLILIVVMVPMTIWLAINYGASGGAASWFILNLIYVFVGTWRVHRKYLIGIGANWLLRDVMFPLCISLFIVGLGNALVTETVSSGYVKMLINAISAIIASLTIILISPRLKYIVISSVRRIKLLRAQ